MLYTYWMPLYSGMPRDFCREGRFHHKHLYGKINSTVIFVPVVQCVKCIQCPIT